MSKDIVIGVLAYNVEDYITSVVDELIELNLPIYIIDDCSTDSTYNKLEKLKEKAPLTIIKNKKNEGAGAATKKIIEHAHNDSYKFLIKVDGDGQFIKKDIEKIVDLYNQKKYQFIKSNRFWRDGIKGKMPKKRFFGNLFATVLMQITTGTNKLFDPLNGLFGISTEIIEKLNSKHYPKRYGYPYFLTISSIINEYKTYQINNVVIYDDQKSSINSFKVFFTLIKLSILFYFKKIIVKKNIGVYQRSAFLDVLCITSSTINLYLIFQIIYTINFASTSLISPASLLFLLVTNLFLNLLLFIASFKEERAIRNTYIDSDR